MRATINGIETNEAPFNARNNLSNGPPQPNSIPTSDKPRDVQVNSFNIEQKLDISLNNPPKVKSYAPGSLPSGNGSKPIEKQIYNERSIN